MWFPGTHALHPIVWHVPWPTDIHQSVISFQNPKHSISNSDLKMAGMLLHYLVLEYLMVLWHIHVAAWCNNTPMVSWTNKLSTYLSPVAGHLVHALAMRIHVNEAFPLVSLSIAGVDNTMANMAS